MKFELKLTDSTNSAVNLRVLVDGKESGVLYFKQEELDNFLKLIKHGIVNAPADVEFINSTFVDDGLEDFEDLD